MDRIKIRHEIKQALLEVNTPPEQIENEIESLVEEEIKVRRDREKQDHELEKEQKKRDHELQKEQNKRDHELQKEQNKRDYELQLARIQQGDTSDSSSFSISTFAKQERKPWNPEHESLSDFLQEFEAWALVCKQDEKMKAMTIKQLIPETYLTVLKSVPAEKTYDYEYIKESLLKSSGSNDQQLRKKFEESIPEEKDQWRLFLSRTHNSLSSWMEETKKCETKKDIIVYLAYLKAIEGMPKNFKTHLAKEYESDISKLGEIGETHLSIYYPNIPLKRLYQKPKQSEDQENKSPPTKRRFNRHQDNHRNGNPSFSSTRPQLDSEGNILNSPPGYSEVFQPCVNHPNSRHRTEECRLNHTNNSRNSNHARRTTVATPSNNAQINQSNPRSFRSTDFQNSRNGNNVFSSNHVRIINFPSIPKTEEPTVLELCEIIEPPIEFRDAPQHQNIDNACSINETISQSLPRAQLNHVKGTVNGRPVDILLDNGCESIIVRKDLILPEDISSDLVQLNSIHGSSIAPIASCNLQCDYFRGKTNVVVAKNLHYDVMLGEVPGTRPFPQSKNSLISTKAHNEALSKQDLQKGLPHVITEYATHTPVTQFQPKADVSNLKDLSLPESAKLEDLAPLGPDLTMCDEVTSSESFSKAQKNCNTLSSFKHQEPDLTLSHPFLYPALPAAPDEDEMATPTFKEHAIVLDDIAPRDSAPFYKIGPMNLSGIHPNDTSFKKPFTYQDKGIDETNKKDETVIEKFGNIFDCPKTYSLAHCISADARMSKGISLDFMRNTDDILKQNKMPGEAAAIYHKGRYIYHLVTKKHFYYKPTYGNLRKSLEDMLMHAIEFGVKDIAIPIVDFNLDSLSWNKVKSIIQQVFSNSNIKIHVYFKDLG